MLITKHVHYIKMGCKTLVGRAFVVAYFVVIGISCFALVDVNKGHLSTGIATLSMYYSKCIASQLPVASLVFSYDSVILYTIGAFLLLCSSCTIFLNSKCTTILLILSIIIGTLLLNPKGIVDNESAVMVFKNIGILGGLLLILVDDSSDGKLKKD